MKKALSLLLVAMIAPALPVQAADGINRLIQVEQAKTNDANDDALKGAEKQRDLIKQQQQLRAKQSAMDAKSPRDPALRQQLLAGLTPGNELQPRLVRFGVLLRDMGATHIRSPRDPALHSKAKQARAQLAELIGVTDRLRVGFINTEKHIPSNGGKSSVEELRRKFDEMNKELESQDRLGNFEIQRLMSAYNQAETLASSVKRKQDETNSSVIGKI